MFQHLKRIFAGRQPAYVPARLSVGSVDQSGKWAAFETVDIRVADVESAKAAAWIKVQNTPLWSGANQVRMFIAGTRYDLNVTTGTWNR